MPDSAEYYFMKVINDYRDFDATSISYYSLSELLYSLNELEDARSVADELINYYPNSEYAIRLAERYQIPLVQEKISLSESDSLKLVYDEISKESSGKVKADSLRNFANIYSDFYLSPRILLDAAIEYSELEKDSTYYADFALYEAARNSYKGELDLFEAYKDSIRVLSADTSLTLAQQAAFKTKLDTVFKKPDYEALFPYFGEYWDTTRVVLDEFKLKFNESNLIDPVRRLATELTIPEIFFITEEVADSTITDSLITGLSSEKSELEVSEPKREVNYLSCRDLRLTPEIEGGMKTFVDSLEIYVIDSTTQFFMIYKFKISREGEVVNYEYVRSNVDEEFRDVIEEAIEDRLRFIPFTYQDEAIPVECDVTFDLSASE